MHGISLLFDNNPSNGIDYKLTIRNRCCVYNDRAKIFGINSVLKLVKFVNYIDRKRIRLPIKIEIEASRFSDKLSLTLFECVCHYIITILNVQVIVSIDSMLTRHSIWADGVHSSPIGLLTTGKREDQKKYISKFEREFYKNHYRYYVSAKETQNSSFLSRMYDDISTFQLLFKVKDDCRDTIAEVLIELIGNACEHTKTDCLIDIDIAPNYHKIGDDSEYYGINISIINFSKQLFYDDMAKKLMNFDDCSPEGRYKILYETYQEHQTFFSENYQKRDFCTVAAFQHKISGRIDNSTTGGTGLTKLIKGLQEQSDAYNCYMVSGNRMMTFRSEYLEYNDEEWIGFNVENEFIHHIPDISLFSDVNFCVPGTAFNLTFAMKKED